MLKSLQHGTEDSLAWVSTYAFMPRRLPLLWLHWDQPVQVVVQQQLRTVGMQEQQI